MAKKILDPTVRGHLAALAEALFPLADWLLSADKFTPPEHATRQLPWRVELGELSIASLESLHFFEEALEERHDERHIERFQKLGKAPLSGSPLGDAGVKAWRKARNLDVKDVRFGPAAADKNLKGEVLERNDNVELAIRGLPVTHRVFWSTAFAQLQQVVDLRHPVGPIEWGHVVKDLLDDKDDARVKTVTGWDTVAAGIKPSSFLRAFVQELLVILLGGQKDLRRADPRWNFALAIEVGEHRRPGNAFSVADTRPTTQQLRAKVAEVSQRTAK